MEVTFFFFIPSDSLTLSSSIVHFLPFFFYEEEMNYVFFSVQKITVKLYNRLDFNLSSGFTSFLLNSSLYRVAPN